MAWDTEFINEVRVYFETHEDDLTEVAKKFDAPSTTVNTWKKQGKANEGIEWVKGKYKGNLQAAKKILGAQQQNEILAAAKDELAAEILGGNTTPTDAEQKNAADIAEALLKDMLVLGNLNREMAWAVVKAKSFAETAKNIGTIKVYAEIVEKAKNQIFGKDPDIVNIFSPNNINVTPQELKGKSTAELVAMMQELSKKNEPIDAEVAENGEN